MTSAQTTTQLSRWDAMLSSYERWGEPVSTVFANAAMERVAPTKGMHILDIGAGLGNLALPAAARGCSVLAIDNASGMVELLNERLAAYPNSRAELMNARDLKVGVATFDAVFSVLCVTFISDYASPFERIVRALKPGGTIAFVHWGTAYSAPFFETVLYSLRKMGFSEAATKPPMDTFLEPSELVTALRGAGCIDVNVEPLVADCEFPEPDVFLDELDFFFQLSETYRNLDRPRKEQLRKVVAEDVARVPVVDGRRVLPCHANLFIAKTAPSPVNETSFV